LLPFVVVFGLHDPLGMTDAFLMGDRASAHYNLMTFAVLVFGSLAYVVCAFALPIVKASGWRWIPLKIVFLVLLLGCFPSGGVLPEPPTWANA
jgi:hypothetical protein